MVAARDASIMSRERTNPMNNSIVSGRSGYQLYESMTIKNQYEDYMVIKDGTFQKAQWVVRMSYAFMLVFAIYLLLTVVFIFTDQNIPVLARLSIAMAGSSETVAKQKMDPWIVRLFNVGTMLIYLSQTVFIMYHKGTLKVNTSRTIRSCAVHHLIIFIIVSMAFFIINIIYFVVNVENPGKSPFVLIGIMLVLITLQAGLFLLFFKLADSSVKQMMMFHEYLVNYRLTPRSRILRKHMPKMEAIVEQESAFESSSIMMS